jgi:hypothetical protein
MRLLTLAVPRFGAVLEALIHTVVLHDDDLLKAVKAMTKKVDTMIQRRELGLQRLTAQNRDDCKFAGVHKGA